MSQRERLTGDPDKTGKEVVSMFIATTFLEPEEPEALIIFAKLRAQEDFPGDAEILSPEGTIAFKKLKRIA